MNEAEEKSQSGVEVEGGALGLLRKIMNLKRADEIGANQAPADQNSEIKPSPEKKREDYSLTTAQSAFDQINLKVRWQNLSQEDKRAYNEYVTKFKAVNPRVQLSTGMLSVLPVLLEAQIHTAHALKLRRDPDYDRYVDERNLRKVAEDWFSFDLSK